MQQILNKLNLEDSSIKLYFITKITESSITNYSSYTVDLNKQANNFRDDFLEKLQKDIENKPLNEFDVVSPEEDSIEYLPSTEVNNLSIIKSLLNPITSRPITDLDLILNDIWGYVAVLTLPDKKQVNIFRKYMKVSAYKAKAQFRLKNGQLEQIKPEQSIFLDFKTDSIEVDDKMYILNRYYFHIFFSFESAYVQFVEKALDDLSSLDIIENFGDFSKRCLSSGNLTKKLVTIIKENRLQWFKENIDKMPTMIKEYNLKVELQNNKIHFTKNGCKISDVMKLIMRCCVEDPVDGTKMFASRTKVVTTQ
ncbi:Kiwa anti-phage protein KwaB-like domain-containing protein [Lysinibacillus sp. NPDC093197]|uniref:Kiwa anti-phage protein KwaB-like domain-containing protein n=1 Tax=Lysinibacillus sp. NPDC093197 TaxID=3364132 RepID=UPI003803F3ED